VLATMEMLIDGDFGPLTQEQRQAIGDSEGKAEDLLTLIEDLLEVRRIEEAALVLNLEKIAPGALLTEVQHEWQHRFQQEKAQVSVEAADDAPVFQADRALIKRVLGNLIQNALTHSANAVTLKLSVRRENDGALFSITDNGPGIPAEYHELIFRKFEQVKTPNAPRVRSSGLGLAFCKLVVESHGGRIWVRSDVEGKGSTFHFLLPPKPPASVVPVDGSGAPAKAVAPSR
jgi:signal transduction histidine kinase